MSRTPEAMEAHENLRREIDRLREEHAAYKLVVAQNTAQLKAQLRQLESENAEMAELLDRVATEFAAYASEGNGLAPRICDEARALLAKINGDA